MHVDDSERVELVKYQLKGVAMTWFDRWKDGTDEDAPQPSCACFKEIFLGCFFPRELKEAKVSQFLTVKKDSLSVHEYWFKFT